MPHTDSLEDKIRDVQQAMKTAGMWKLVQPQWVHEFEGQAKRGDTDFAGWLQFVYLPNLLAEAGHQSALTVHKSIVPQAMKAFGEDIQKGMLLQRLIELDALS